MLIVEDPPGSLPPEVASAPERVLLFHDVRAPSLANIAARQEASCRAAGNGAGACTEAFWTAAAATQHAEDMAVLVNGERTPHIPALEAGVWYRFRMLYGSSGGGAAPPRPGGGMRMHGRRLQSDWSGDDLRPRLRGCVTTLLAKDGVYLPTAPRPIAFGFLAAGNRADWLVQCPAGTHALTDDETGGRLATVTVQPSSAPPAPPVAPFAVGRPCYLADLSRVAPNVSHSVELAHMTFGLTTDGRYAAFRGADAPAATLPVGAVTELRIGGTGAMDHVYHQHVNPFQLMEPPHALTRVAVGNYFEAGDWHDTLREPFGGGGMRAMQASMHSELRVRFQTDAFAGTVPMHCHYLVHEDQGMLAVFDVTGREGASYAGRGLPACYTGRTPDPWRRVLAASSGAAAKAKEEAAGAVAAWSLTSWPAEAVVVVAAAGAVVGVTVIRLAGRARAWRGADLL